MMNSALNIVCRQCSEFGLREHSINSTSVGSPPQFSDASPGNRSRRRTAPAPLDIGTIEGACPSDPRVTTRKGRAALHVNSSRARWGGLSAGRLTAKRSSNGRPSAERSSRARDPGGRDPGGRGPGRHCPGVPLARVPLPGAPSGSSAPIQTDSVMRSCVTTEPRPCNSLADRFAVASMKYRVPRSSRLMFGARRPGDVSGLARPRGNGTHPRGRPIVGGHDRCADAPASRTSIVCRGPRVRSHRGPGRRRQSV